MCGRFIRHPYGTAHQDAECGHIGGRAYGRAMWTHRWQSVSYYLLRSAAAWDPKCPPRGPHAGPKRPPRRCQSDPSRVPSIPHPPRSRTTPLHTASDVEKMPRHPRPEPSKRIKTALKGHPRAPQNGVEKMKRAPRSTTLEPIKGYATEIDLPPHVRNNVAEMFRLPARCGHGTCVRRVHAHMEDATQWLAMQRHAAWRGA